MFDPKAIRNDFPILSRQVHGKPLVYLDNAATTQKPHLVIEALRRYYEESNANVHRGIHTLAEEATALYEQARQHVARFIHAPEARSIVFTRGATEAINLVAQAWGRWALKPGDEILLTEMEHHSNLVPWQLVAQETGAALQFVGLTAEGELDQAHAKALLTERTKLFAVTHASNVLGTINPIAELVQQAHAVGALVLVDGAQSVPHMPVDVQALDCDFLAFSGHKMLGPTGIGVLYAKPELLETMPPFQGGGEMIANVWLDHASWNEIPWKFEAGTPNIAGAIGLGAAVEYLGALGMEAVRAHEQSLVAYALAAFERLNHETTIYGPKDPARRGGVVAFNLREIHPHDVGQFLDGEGVAIRAGHHCAKPLMRRLGVVATARASFYLYNTTEEVDALMAALKKTKETFSLVAH